MAAAFQGSEDAGTTTRFAPKSDDAEGPDTALSPAAPEVVTRASYAPTSDVSERDELHYRVLAADIYKDLSDAKTSTLRWVIGIVVPVVVALMVLTWTMNQSLRDDVTTLIESLRQEFRGEAERLDRGMEELDGRVNDLESPPVADPPRE